MPETRAQRIERLEHTANRTPFQDSILEYDRQIEEAVARTDALDHQHRNEN